MSEQTAHTTGTEETNSQEQEAAKEFQAITSQEDFDKAIQARIARERAKIPADYDDLKAKAAKLAEIEAANQTEAEKAAARADAAEKRAIELELRATRAEVAAAKGVPADLLAGSTQEELEASADALIQFRGEQGKPRLVVGSEGTAGKATTSPRAQFAELIKTQIGS